MGDYQQFIFLIASTTSFLDPRNQAPLKQHPYIVRLSVSVCLFVRLFGAFLGKRLLGFLDFLHEDRVAYNSKSDRA